MTSELKDKGRQEDKEQNWEILPHPTNHDCFLNQSHKSTTVFLSTLFISFYSVSETVYSNLCIKYFASEDVIIMILKQF